jgi:hypothetical protein
MKTITTDLVSVVSVVKLPDPGVLQPVWGVPPKKEGYVEIRDEFWSATFGICQEALANITDPVELILDFSRLCWIDPFPLLGILIAAKTFCARSGSSLTVLLGDEPVSNHDIMIRGGFLKFVSLHGFLSNLKDMKSDVHLGASTYAADDEKLYEKLDSNSYVMAYPDSICLEAIIEPVTKFQEEDSVTQTVTNWTTRIKKSRISSFFEGEPDKFNDLITKIHNLIVEILLNAGEHAYAKDEASSCYVGLYARLREPAGQLSKNLLQKKGYITTETQCCPGVSKFELSGNNSVWLEFFYMDQGRGFVDDLEEWIINASPALKERLEKIKSTSNPLHEIGKVLFKEPLSRHTRENKTMLTGLQYVRNSLSDNEESARLYSSGEWVAERLPWHPDRAGSADNLAKRTAYVASDKIVHFTKGTLWHFCLSLDALTEKYGDPPPEWEKITSGDIRIEHPGKTQLSDWQVFDDRNLGGGLKSRKWHLENFTKPFSLWLPELVRKNQVLFWMNEIVHKPKKQVSQDRWVWIFADMSRKDASLMDAVLSSEESLRKRNSVWVYLITRDWCVKCYKSITSRQSGSVFKQDEGQARKVKEEYGAFILEKLRENDSAIFWQGVLEQENSASAFICEEVIWERDDNKEPSIKLNGYLDLTHALLDPTRKFVARRALERTWLLYAHKAECVAADPLLTDLLPGDARMSLQEISSRTDDRNLQIVVGSVFVTGRTAQRAALSGQFAIHLLRHGEVKGATEQIDPRLCALDWLKQPINLLNPPTNKLQYERLPGTPYISRGGPKAAPIRRFVKIDDDLFAESVYGKDPQQTYKDMIRFDLLKLGHWVYGTHHDLLTMNLAYGVESKRFYKGTATEWILGELKKQAQHNGGSYRVMVVYPSHAVTDKLVEALKNLAQDNRTLNLTFIPVRFWASHSQTAIRIPSLTYDRIRDELFVNNMTKIVLLDDAAVTGKVQREMEQLLRNAGAKEVIHLGMLSRTGLPLYRKYLCDVHRNTHRYYWRWDVPPLGNASTCSLCRSIDLARQLARRMWRDEARAEIEEWVSAWTACSVTNHWRRHGLSPGQLPDIRKITFGKDWQGKGEGKKYKIEHGTTTGLAATVIEIIRTTSYKGVGLKFARVPWEDDYPGDRSKWRDATLEILLCQLFIYFDDFDDEEVQERFQLLLKVLLAHRPDMDNPDRTKQLERLGCLALLLATDKQVDILTKQLWRQTTNVHNPDDDLLLMLGGLMERAGTYQKQIEELRCSSLKQNEKTTAETLLTDAYLFSQGKNARGTRHAFYSLYLLLGKQDNDRHAGFCRKRLTGEIYANKREICRDLQIIETALREISPLVLTGNVKSSFDTDNHADLVHDYVALLQKNEVALDSVKAKILSEIFDSEKATAKSFREDIISTAEEIRNFLTRSISTDEWKKKIEDPLCKKHHRWTDQGCLPDINVCMDKVLDPAKVCIVCPPILKTMIKEFIYNVLHSSEKIFFDGLFCDLNCILYVKDKALILEMMNHAENEDCPRIKPSETMVSTHLIHNPVQRSYKDNQMNITVCLPLIEHFYGSKP